MLHRCVIALGVLSVIVPAGSGVVARCEQSLPSAQLQVIVIDGEGALNNIKQRIAREPIVQVDDENHKPVAGAIVTFTLPELGPSGSFANGATVLSVHTDASGRAIGQGLRPNTVQGRFAIRVDAQYRGLIGHASITQTNAPGTPSVATHVATHAFPLKAVLIIAVAGAAAVATGVALQSGGNQSATITPGTGTVGAPSAGHRHR